MMTSTRILKAPLNPPTPRPAAPARPPLRVNWRDAQGQVVASRPLTAMTSVTGLTAPVKRASLQPPCPAGVLLGRCSGWVDLGMQKNRFQADAKPQRRVLITWTLEGPAGERWRVSKEYAWCAGPRAALRKLLEDWRGRPYATDEEAWAVIRDPRRVLEQAALVRVTLRPAGSPDKAPWPDVAGVWPLMKGQTALPLKWPPTLYVPGSGEDVKRALPAWVQARMGNA